MRPSLKRSVFRPILFLFVLLSVGILWTGCDDFQEALDDIFGELDTESGRRDLADESAFVYLSRDRTDAPETPVAAIRAVIDHESKEEAGLADSQEVLDEPQVANLYQRVRQARLQINPDPDGPFKRIPFDEGLAAQFFHQNKSNTIMCPNPASFWDINLNNASLQNDYLIPQAEKIPVRNQGYRGTCAAFAGIGTIEYAVLNEREGLNPDLPTLDLSEQRFFWQSKPDCHSSGHCDDGSWYGNGFDDSRVSTHLDIPLETDCPYVSQPTGNAAQHPLLDSCHDNGAVKVENIEQWCSLEEAIDYLNRGYAVAYASPLSRNWERNEGMITKRQLEAAGDTGHAEGHGYLLVGYKLLPHMPEEGGICFYVKNSWGPGWGVGGYSCMTLAWMKEVRFDFISQLSNPVVTGLSLRADLQSAAQLPPDNDAAETEQDQSLPPDEAPPEEDEHQDEVLPAPEAPDLNPYSDGEPGEFAPPPADQFIQVQLLGPDESFFKAMVFEEHDHLYVRGVLRQNADITKALKVLRQGTALYFKGDQVGEFSTETGRLALCSGNWEYLCLLTYRSGDNQIYIQYRSEDLRSLNPALYSSDKGSWENLTIGSRSVGFFIPNESMLTNFLQSGMIPVRTGSNALPQRLRLGMESATRYNLRLSGIRVGELDFNNTSNAALCSGQYSDNCRLSGGHIIPGNRRNHGDTDQ